MSTSFSSKSRVKGSTESHRIAGPGQSIEHESAVLETHDNLHTQSVRRGLRVQAKLEISQPQDADELEADQTAERVMRMPDSAIGLDNLSISRAGKVQRACAQCEEDQPIQRSASGASAPKPAATGFQVPARHTGQPLPPSTREFCEPRFGHDFSKVRVHADASAAESARAISARAYTHQDQIVFGAGHYSPETTAGKQLLAHELTHVLQQSEGRSGVTIQRTPDEPFPLPVAGEVMEVGLGPITGDIPLGGGENVIVVSWPLGATEAIVQLPPPYLHAYQPFNISKSLLTRRAVATAPTAVSTDYADRVSAALSQVDPIAGVGNFPEAFRILQELSIRDLAATLAELDRRYLLDILRFNVNAQTASGARIEAVLLAVAYQTRGTISGPDMGRFRELLGQLDPTDRSAIGQFIGLQVFEVLTGAQADRTALFVVRAFDDDFVIAFESWPSTSSNGAEVHVMISPADISRASQTEMHYFDVRGRPVESGESYITAASWGVPAVPFTQKLMISDRATFNPTLLGNFPEATAKVWTFDWDDDGRPNYGLRIEHESCLIGTWEQFRYQRAPAGHRYCNISRNYQLIASDQTNVSRFGYHFIQDDAWRFGYTGNFTPRREEDNLDFWRAATEMAITMIPVVGEIVLIAEAITGRSIFGERLSTSSRVIAALAALLPLAGGAIARGVARESAELVNIAARLGRSQEEVLALLRAVEKQGGAQARNLEHWQATLRAGGQLTAAEMAGLRKLIQQIEVDMRISRAQARGALHVESSGASVPMRRIYTDPFSGVTYEVSATAGTSRSLVTSIRADIGEVEAYRAALGRREIGLLRPGGANVPGVDFITAVRDSRGGIAEVLANDAKTSIRGVFPTPRTTVPAAWMTEIQNAVAPGRLNLGNAALERQVRDAVAQGRVRLRQLNVDYSPAGQGTVTGW